MKKIIFLPLLLTAHMSLACEGFLPKNILNLPVTDKNEGLSREEYDDVIDLVEKVYAPVVRSHRAILKINRDWESGTVNAGTLRYENGKYWLLKLYGGLARHKFMTKDAYAMVLCHELGHHLGGAPKKKGHWSSTEGQSDYWASLKCFRRIFENEKYVPSKEFENECSNNFQTASEIALCKRSSLAGYALSKISREVRGGDETAFHTPDPAVVEYIYEKHPKPQCRLDTFYQGSICQIGWRTMVSQVYDREGTCHPDLGFNTGTRPLCWYKP